MGNANHSKLPELLKWSLELKGKEVSRTSKNLKGMKLFELKEGSKDHQRVMALIETMGGFEGLSSIAKIIAIRNPHLEAAFCNHLHILAARWESAPEIFGRKDWTHSANHDARVPVVQHLEDELKKQFGEAAPVIPILLCANGTDYAIAESIASTGHCIISSLDAGFYGKGIYFSSSIPYCYPYWECKRSPCVLLSWVMVGNPYPVIESHDGENSLLGEPLKNGYTSHYVVTGRNGRVYDGTNRQELTPRDKSQCLRLLFALKHMPGAWLGTKEGLPRELIELIVLKSFATCELEARKYNEIVVSAESQTLPVFIIELDHRK